MKNSILIQASGLPKMDSFAMSYYLMGVTMKHVAQNLMLIRATTTFVKTGSTIRTIPVLQLMVLLSVMTNFITRVWYFSGINK